MPALPNAPQVMKVVLQQTIGADTTAIDRLYFQYIGPAPSNAACANWAAAISNSWLAHITPLQDVDTTLTEVSVTDLTSPTSGFGVNLTAHIGTRAGGVLGADMCALIRETIARRYRGGHPRVYLRAGNDNDLLTPQSWTPAFVTAVSNGWLNFIADDTLPAPLGVVSIAAANVSYFKGFTNFTFPSGRVRAIPTVRPAPVVDLITAFACQVKPASQRRRTLQSA